MTGRFSEFRTIAGAYLLSLGLHAAVMVVVFAIASVQTTVEVEFEESRGVALIGRLGYVPVDDDPTNDVEIDELPDEIPEDIDYLNQDDDAEAAAEPEPEPEPEEAEPEEVVEPEPEEVVEPEPDEAAEPEEEPEPEPEEIVVVATPEPEDVVASREERRRERRERREREAAEAAEREAREAAEREAAEREAREAAEREAAERDPSRLPPAERYPEGTLNPVATDIGMWGPEGARLVVITRNDRIRTSRHRRNMETLLSSLPDWQMLVGGGEIDPFRDVDAMLIASANPRYINQTFVAALHHVSPVEVVDALSSGFPGGVDWEEDDGRLYGTPRGAEALRDPRVFMLPADRLFIYARPEFIDPLEHRAPTARGLDGAAEHIDTLGEVEAEVEVDDVLSRDRRRLNLGDRLRDRSGGGRQEAGDAEAEAEAQAQAEADAEAAREEARRAERRARRSNRADEEPPTRDDGWVRGLLDLTDFGGTGRDGAAIVVTMNEFSNFRIQGMGRVDPPRAAHMNIMLENDPIITGRMVFSDQADAEAFIARWPEIVEANGGQLRLTGFYQPLRDAEWVVDHNEATFTVTVPRDSVERLADTVSAYMRAVHSD